LTCIVSLTWPSRIAHQVESLHPGQRDSEIFDSFGLLTDRCVMAHCVHLTPEELKLCATRKSGIAHCALSNFLLSVGDFPLRRAQVALSCSSFSESRD